MKEKISQLSLFTLLFFNTTATALMQGMHPAVGSASFLVVPIGALLSLPLYLLMIYTKKQHPARCLGDLLEEWLGVWGSRIVFGVYIVFTLFNGMFLTGYLTRFISFTGENQQVAAVFSAFFFLLCYFGARISDGAAARFSRLLFPGACFLLVLSLGLCLLKFDPNAVLPLCNAPLTDFSIASVSLMLFPFCQIIPLLPFLFRVKGRKTAKPLLWGLGLSALVITLAYLGTAGVLGQASLQKLNYPYYMALSVLDVTSFFQRIEVLLSIHFVLAMLITCILCLRTACNCTARLFRQEHPRLLAAPLSALMLAASLILFSTSSQLEALLAVYPYLTIPFVIVIPLIIFFFSKRKKS